MIELIDREATVKQVCKIGEMVGGHDRDVTIAVALFVQDDKSAFPTIEIPHGEWIEKPSYKEDKELGIDKQVVCSRCDEQNSHYVYGKDGQIEGKMFIRSNFCPNCGADMRGGDTNDQL